MGGVAVESEAAAPPTLAELIASRGALGPQWPAGTVVDQHGSRRLTIVTCVKPLAIVVTIDADRRGTVFVDEEASAAFSLHDRSATTLRQVHREMSEFFHRHGIREVVLRTRSGGGHYSPDPQHTKIEALLQLMPSIKLWFVDALAGSSWIDNHRFDFPPALSLELGQRFDNAKLVALGMAMYIDHRRDEAGGLLFDGEAD